jgi:hypothetical protein
MSMMAGRGNLYLDGELVKDPWTVELSNDQRRKSELYIHTRIRPIKVWVIMDTHYSRKVIIKGTGKKKTRTYQHEYTILYKCYTKKP